MIDKILKKIKQNKKYESIADSVVKNEIIQYLKSNPKEKINKQMIKQIRAKLHKNYASFQTKKKKKAKDYISNLKQLLDDKSPSSKEIRDIEINKIINKLLSMTISTKERLNDYAKLYKQIFQITNNPKIIIDLGCGLNPLSYLILNKIVNSNPKYYCYDINTEDINILNKFFKKFNINGKATILDLRDKTKIKKLPKSDIIFLFKLIDIIDKSEKNHKKSEELIKTIIPKTKFIIASFATHTITRKKMNYPNRKWFELMLSRNNLSFQTIKTDNEVFYVLSE